MTNLVKSAINEAIVTFNAMHKDETLCAITLDIVKASVNALKNGKKIFFCGNGGSAADAQHWAGELVSRFYYDRPGLPAIALTTDTSILTAIGNDYGYDRTFSRQIEALAVEGDVLFAISTSGNSSNIISAVETAKERGLIVVGFTGQNESKLHKLSDLCIRIPSTSTPRIQEGHEIIGHTICALIESEMFPR